MENVKPPAFSLVSKKGGPKVKVNFTEVKVKVVGEGQRSQVSKSQGQGQICWGELSPSTRVRYDTRAFSL